jgi:probable HAF family extracellular repeat protein
VVRRPTAASTLVAVASLLFAFAASGADATSDGHRWVIRDLGTLGGQTSTAVALNESGQVVGTSVTARGERHAFLWRADVLRDLGTLGGGTSEAVDVNAAGQVVGNSPSKGCETSHGFIWQKGRMRDLGAPELLGSATGRDVAVEVHGLNGRGQVIGGAWLLPDCSWDNESNLSETEAAFVWQNGKLTELGVDHASAINERGQITGTYAKCLDDDCEDLDLHVFRWQRGRLVDLATFPEADPSETWDFAINDDGLVVGSVRHRRAVAYDGSTRVALGTLGGSANEAVAVNNRGQIVGWSNTRAGVRHATLWEEGRAVDIGVLAGYRRSSAVGVNADGQVIGASADPGTKRQQAFVWEDDTLVGLELLPGGKASAAIDINDRGQIVGWATTRTGATHAVLWTSNG